MASLAALRRQAARLPEAPGVYLFRDGAGGILYVGKALSLRQRVVSYFRRTGPLAPRIARLVRQVRALEVLRTASEGEALLLEAQLIKAHRPRYNVALRDDKTYPLLKITNEPYPRLVVTRRRTADGARYFGPYPEAGLMHEAVRFLRRVFPLRTCRTFPKSPCLEYHLGQCLAPCVGYVDAAGYRRIVADLTAFLEGRRERLLDDLDRRMRQAARHEDFEAAARVRDQIRALTSVIAAREKSAAAGPLEQLQAALRLPRRPARIEAFDISNLAGTLAVGSMVVFTDGRPHKAHYRHFRIKTVAGIDDYAMMREVIRRRYSGSLAAALPLPDLLLIDGGKGQLAAAGEALAALSLAIPAMGLAKRFEHIFLPGAEEPIVLLATSPVLHLLQHVRDEAHRFAIRYHHLLRRRSLAEGKTRGRFSFSEGRRKETSR
jgi:excinuclease ABC subunit C